MGSRKHFLDWLRIIAFGLLILFHTGMLYVSWSYNLKSPRLVPSLEWLMDAVGPWRMPLLFTISGVASRLMIERLGPGRFALDRLGRLLPVILVGMLVVIPPQTYVELVAKRGLSLSYPSFWFGPYLHGEQALVRPLGKTLPTWDHLWFLVYLLNYALLFAAGFAVHRRVPARSHPAAPSASPWAVVVLPGVWMVVCNTFMLTVAPFTHALTTDWAAHLKWLGLFLVGAHLASRDGVWTWLEHRRRRLAAASVALLAAQLAAIWLVPLERDAMPLREALVRAVPDGLYGWGMVLTAAAFAARWLNRPSAVLAYLNRAVLPVYVLHQPVLLVAAFWLFRLKLSLPLEALLLVAITGGGSLAIYAAAIAPFGAMRWLFGVRGRAGPHSSSPPAVGVSPSQG